MMSLHRCLKYFILVPWACAALPLLASHPCTSPLVLDLDANGIATTGDEDPVLFDINGDGELNLIGWTVGRYEDAFLWLDLNRNRKVDGGAELFGTSTRLPDGRFAANGFEALAVYDQPDAGGNADGAISREDQIWPHLLLWIDSNHDAVSQPAEIGPLRKFGVVSIHLQYAEVNFLDGVANLHAQRGAFVRAVRLFGRPTQRLQTVEDIVFAVFE